MTTESRDISGYLLCVTGFSAGIVASALVRSCALVVAGSSPIMATASIVAIIALPTPEAARVRLLTLHPR